MTLHTTVETAPAHDIVTSVGGYGPEHRIDPLAGGEHDRAYNNVGPYVLDLETALAEWQQTADFAAGITSANNPHTVTREVTRLLTSAGVFAELAAHETVGSRIEAAIPTPRGDWMVYLGENGDDRPHVPVNERKYTDDISRLANTEIRTPVESIEKAVSEGVQLFATIDDSFKAELLELWGGTFGWSEEQINNLWANLEADAQKESGDKHFWFSAAVENGKLVGVAMAERIDMPHPDDEPVHFVESTEWRKKTGSKSYMDATLAYLHTQVLEDIEDAVIYAECNETSGAYNVAHKVHMEDSGRELALLAESEAEVALLGIKNVLKANVYVDDDVEPLTPRNFVVLYLSESHKNRYYDKTAREKIMKLTGGNHAA